MSQKDTQIIEQSRQWVEKVVMGLNLCPFAAPVIKQKTLRYQLSHAKDDEQVLHDFLHELDLIQHSSEDEIATTLLIFADYLQAFDDYLDLLDMMQQLLEQAGLDGEFQLASFHPDYLFDGVDEDDRSHWTNRAPYPTVHLIREGQMSRVLANYKDPDQIPERNMQLLREMDEQQLTELYPHLFNDVQ